TAAGRCSGRRLAKHLGRSPLLRGTKPSKIERPTDNPDKASAVVTAEAPGKQVTGTPACAAATTMECPGSETKGIPASETTKTVPVRAASISCCERCASLWSKLETT